MFGRKKIAMLVAEFLGTGVLTLVVLAVSKSTIGIPYFVAIAAGLVLVAMTLALGAVSGAHLNPAITLGLWTVRKVKTVPALAYVAAQMAGGGAAYWLYTYFIGQSWSNATGKFEAKILIAEAVGALIFSIAWAAAAYQRLEVGKAAAVVGIGLMLGAIVASAVSYGLLNPAVALGVRSFSWVYVLGPILGAIIGFNIYGFLFAPYAKDEAAGSAKKKK
jgi:glycerol uptake facilitator-like aquaporin